MVPIAPVKALTPAEILRNARSVELELPSTSARLAILASFHVDLLRPYLVVEAHELGCPFIPWFGAYGQFEQMLLADSILWQQPLRAIWLAMRVHDVDPRLLVESAALSTSERRLRLDRLLQRLVAVAKAARTATDVPIIVSNFETFQVQLASPFESSDPDSLVHQLAECNRVLARELRALADVHVFDWAAVVAGCGASGFTDPKLWYTARAPIAPIHMRAVSNAVVRSIAAVSRTAAKCIVLDLDNTLWGGVLGDDGMDAIQLGQDYPGNIFHEFQLALLGLAKRGFLLAVVTKNDPEFVEQVLRSHPDMVLRREHFSCIHASWEPKPYGLREVARTLNIGLDSLVFVDDNPVERALVRSELSMVNVIELPPDPLGYLAALRACPLFDQPRVLTDDVNRVEMYRDEASRREMQQKAQSLEEYLEQLGMVAEVGLNTSFCIERIHQLITKTNQFNLTTRRHKLEEIRAMAASPEHRVAWLRLSDSFGSMGLVCVGILSGIGASVIEIDSFVMSCRAMGRAVEDAFLCYLAHLARKAGAHRLKGVYRQTDRNTPVRNFFPSRGFAMVASQPPAVLNYEKDLASEGFPWPVSIQRIDSDERETHGND